MTDLATIVSNYTQNSINDYENYNCISNTTKEYLINILKLQYNFTDKEAIEVINNTPNINNFKILDDILLSIDNLFYDTVKLQAFYYKVSKELEKLLSI